MVQWIACIAALHLSSAFYFNHKLLKVTQQPCCKNFAVLPVYRAIFVVLFFVLPFYAQAQFAPAEAAVLNYRIIGFSFPPKKGTSEYLVEIANGHFNIEKEFTAHITHTASSATDSVIAEVRSFGSEYTWRVIYKSSGSVAATSSLHHFSTGTLPVGDAKSKRLRVDKKNRGIKDTYILVDGVKMMFDLEGQPVWYFPGADSMVGALSDIKISPSGSFTFLEGRGAYEVAYDGKILWTRFNRDDMGMVAPDAFHHEFSKLENGHYMSLLSEVPLSGEALAADGRKRFFPPISSSTLQEFDENGKLVWAWRSRDYVWQSDLMEFQNTFPGSHIDLHENAFFFDERSGVIYLSMVGISRIVKIEYPSGKVLAEYGTTYPGKDTCPVAGTAPQLGQLLANSMFCNQHSLKLGDDNCLYVCSTRKLPGNGSGEVFNCPVVLKMKQSRGSLEKVWEFSCDAIIKNLQGTMGGGGNVVLMPGGRLFISVGIPYDGMYIVDTKKQVHWSAGVETYDPQKNSWIPYVKYRASIITRQQMEKMVWSVKETQDALSRRNP
ncbi:MAG: hypothetical protein K0Q79_3483 [Flavipsychrobacter sp.]|jgi:hypothetical protein|nr:hypothetical protein [Flavipsychrobacter sp.]